MIKRRGRTGWGREIGRCNHITIAGTWRRVGKGKGEKEWEGIRRGDGWWKFWSLCRPEIYVLVYKVFSFKKKLSVGI